MALLINILVFAIFHASGIAAIVEIDPSASKVSFVAVGRPGVMKIHGEGGKVEGKLDLSKKEGLGELSVNLDDFDTGIALRNQHMKEKYLQTNEPSKKIARLKVEKLEFNPELIKNGGKADIPFSGKLLFHGEQKDVSGNLQADVQGNLLKGKTNLKLNLSDYKVEIPSYLGIKVAETVDIEVSLNGKFSEPAKKQ